MAGRTDSGQPDTAFPAGAEARGYGPAPRMVPLMDPDTGLPFVDEFGVPAGGAPTVSPGSAPTGPPGPAPTDSAGTVPSGRPHWAAASEPMPDPAPVPKPEPEPVPEPQPDPGPQDLPPTAGIEAAEELLDTAERAVLTDALGVVDAGSRVTSPATTEETGPARPASVRPGSRRVPDEDPDLTERRGPSLPGAPALCAGLLAAASCGALLWWHGMLPDQAVRLLRLPGRAAAPLSPRDLALLVLGCAATLFALGGLARGRVGGAWVLSLFGRYRGTVRRTGLVWINPVLRRRRVDVRLRHWRSEPMPAVDAAGVQLRAVVLVVWRVVDAARARYAVDDHVTYLREQVEAGTARVLGRLPADAFHEESPSLRDADAVGDALTAQLAADCRPVGIEVFSAQPTRIEYAPEVATAMHRRQIAAIDARHRDTVLTSVVDAVDDTVRRLTTRGLVELDDYERKALVKDLTVAFYTARGSAAAQE
ncbi:SPFH domain-containing protein [Streptomyces purpurogeneiscleroticus]|uniref:SPFH domain-containing protein n=1 Tax=Streptomyces purpurogeneiscleroticus TaxID=68259 RepID=UPI001CBBE6B6|nr:SPFH domain-containing protein [Streptomyces purpurogeneiscleroticus]